MEEIASVSMNTMRPPLPGAMPYASAFPSILLLGTPPALARSMANALNRSWLKYQGNVDWCCEAAAPAASLPLDSTIYLLATDWRNADEESTAQEQHWRSRLHAEVRDYVVLHGSPDRQWQQLADSLKAHAPIADWSWLPASPTSSAPHTTRLRAYGCEQCSDPDCERRLFDALRSGRG